MSRKDVARAKDLFLEFGGNKMHMGRDNCLDEYKSYVISREMEQEWVGEFSRTALENYEISNLVETSIIRAIWAMVNYECKSDFSYFAIVVYDNIGRIDTYGKLLLSRKLADVKDVPNEELSKKIKNLLLFVVESLVHEKKVTVDQRYVERQLIPETINNESALLKGVKAMKERVLN